MYCPVPSNSINGCGPRLSTRMLPLLLTATPEVLPNVMPAGSLKSSGTAT